MIVPPNPGKKCKYAVSGDVIGAHRCAINGSPDAARIDPTPNEFTLPFSQLSIQISNNTYCISIL